MERRGREIQYYGLACLSCLWREQNAGKGAQGSKAETARRSCTYIHCTYMYSVVVQCSIRNLGYSDSSLVHLFVSEAGTRLLPVVAVAVSVKILRRVSHCTPCVESADISDSLTKAHEISRSREPTRPSYPGSFKPPSHCNASPTRITATEAHSMLIRGELDKTDDRCHSCSVLVQLSVSMKQTWASR